MLDSVEEIAGSHSGDEKDVVVGVRLARPVPDVGECLRGAAFGRDGSKIGDFALYAREGEDTAVVVADDVVFIGSPARLRLALLHRGPEEVGTGPLEAGEAMRLSMRSTAEFAALDGVVRAGPNELAVAGQATFYTLDEAEHAATFLGGLNDQIRAEFGKTKTGAQLPPNLEIVHVTREGRTIRLTAGVSGASGAKELEDTVRTMAGRH